MVFFPPGSILPHPLLSSSFWCLQSQQLMCKTFQKEIISQALHKNECFYYTKVTWKVYIKSGMTGAPLSSVPLYKLFSVKFGSCEHPVSLFWKQNWTNIDVCWNSYFDVLTKASVPTAHIIFWSPHCIKSTKREKKKSIKQISLLSKSMVKNPCSRIYIES